MVDSLSASQARKHFCFFGVALHGNDERNVLTDRLVLVVPENTLRARVPRGDDPVERLSDNRVVAGVDQGCQTGVDDCRVLASVIEVACGAHRTLGLRERGDHPGDEIQEFSIACIEQATSTHACDEDS